MNISQRAVVMCLLVTLFSSVMAMQQEERNIQCYEQILTRLPPSQKMLHIMARIAEAIFARAEKERRAEMLKVRTELDSALKVLRSSLSSQQEKEQASETVEFLNRLSGEISVHFAKKTATQAVLEEASGRALFALNDAVERVSADEPHDDTPREEFKLGHYQDDLNRALSILNDAESPLKEKRNVARVWYFNELRWAEQQSKKNTEKAQQDAPVAQIDNKKVPILSPEQAAQKAEYEKTKRIAVKYIHCNYFSEDVRYQAALDFYLADKAEKDLTAFQSTTS